MALWEKSHSNNRPSAYNNLKYKKFAQDENKTKKFKFSQELCRLGLLKD